MRILSSEHQHGDTICRVDFPSEHEALTHALSLLEAPLYEFDAFTTTGRPLKPKRHVRDIGGVTLPALLPVDQRAMNATLKRTLESDDWTSEPVAAGPMAGPDTPLNLRGDFVRNRVFVEVEFGNVASMHRDFFKFQIANRSGAGDVGVLVVATQRFAQFFDTNVATYETALRNRPYLAIGVQMPIWIVGIEPEDFVRGVGARYAEMFELCKKNAVECHSFDAVLASHGEGIRSAEIEPDN